VSDEKLKYNKIFTRNFPQQLSREVTCNAEIRVCITDYFGGSGGSMNRGPRAPGAPEQWGHKNFLDKTLRKENH